jgi:hypothetical protein
VNKPTLIDIMIEAMEGHSTARLMEIALGCETDRSEEARVIKYASIELIERRNPEVNATLDAWANDINEERSYLQQLADLLAMMEVQG